MTATDTRPYPLRAVPGYFSSRPGIQIGSTISSDATDDDLRLLQQLGVEWVMVNIASPEEHTVERYRELVRRVADYGMQIYRIARHDVHNVEQITLNLPGRDEKIEDFCSFLRMLGAAGIRYHTYAHMGNGIWTTSHTEGRGGVRARELDLSRAKGYWNGKVYEGNLTHGREYTEEELWDNYAYFIRKVMRVAEDEGIYIGFHPDDPPVYALGGVPRVTVHVGLSWGSRLGCGVPDSRASQAARMNGKAARCCSLRLPLTVSMVSTNCFPPSL